MEYLYQGIIQAFRLLFSGDPETYSAVAATLKASSLSMAASLLLGVPAGFALGHFQFPGRRQIRLVVDTLLALPTVFIGLLVYAMISRQGPMGHMGLLFTIPGIAIGQAILALPVVIALSATAIESMDANLRVSLITLGASRRQLLLTSLWEMRHGILAAGLTAFWDRLEGAGASHRVLVATMSEFGRRVAENASSGCDHGAAGASLLMGESIRGGLHGALDTGDLLDGDLRPGIDPRTMFTACLDWLGADVEHILGSRYDEIQLLP